MSPKALAAKILAKRVAKRTAKWTRDPLGTQEKVFRELIKRAGSTQFGKAHDFGQIQSPADFVSKVPLRDYEEFKDYIQKIIDGGKDVLWPGVPLYFGKTSGTTSGAKYIPISKESIKEQVKAARNAILSYVHETGNADFVDGKMIFLQGSPVLEKKGKIKMGRLSGISALHVPKYLQKNRLPSWETNCIEDWETKVDMIVQETQDQNMTVISGIPSWVQMYFEKLNQKTGKKVGELFKNFQLFIYGGVNYGPYRAKFEKLIGRKVDSIELFPASEGFFAYQDSQREEGMLLLLDAGIFYEFIKADEFFDNPKRITLKDVELHTDYALIVSTNAGLWAYNIGDTVRFVSKDPYRIIVSGRIKHFISAFGEHVIAKEVEQALREAVEGTDALVNEFTVAPQTDPPQGELPYHEWLIEFENRPSDPQGFAKIIEESMKRQNSYYLDIIEGNILQPLKITEIKRNGFQDYMRTIGKLGGQNKLQRLSNDRKLADGLQPFITN